MYVKSNDAAAIGELNDAELDAVSGGASALINAAVAGLLAGAGKGAGPYDDGQLPKLPCDSFDIICRILP
jgi:hypothetical protein